MKTPLGWIWSKENENEKWGSEIELSSKTDMVIFGCSYLTYKIEQSPWLSGLMKKSLSLFFLYTYLLLEECTDLAYRSQNGNTDCGIFRSPHNPEAAAEYKSDENALISNAITFAVQCSLEQI